MEVNRDLLPEMWSVALESKNQGPIVDDLVRQPEELLVCATEAVELEL